MVRAVLPRPGERATWLLTGRAEGELHSNHRAAPLAEDTEAFEERHERHSEGHHECRGDPDSVESAGAPDERNVERWGLLVSGFLVVAATFALVRLVGVLAFSLG